MQGNECINDLKGKEDKRLSRIIGTSGVVLHDCYQCGKCSAGCPMADEMDMMPRQIVRCLQLGLVEDALKSKAPWICAGCHVCSERCPNGIDICAVMEAVRQEADRADIHPVRTVSLFTRDFMIPIRWFGRSHEMTMTAFYNLTSGHLLQNFAYLPRMLRGGKLRIWPHQVKDKKHIRKIMENCEREAQAK